MDQKKTYEGMFLLEAGKSDFESTTEPIRTVLQRCDAELLSLKPWEERRLAYEIEGRRRGLYALTYFKADPLKIGELEHDCQLNENILRVLILRRENISEDVINAETPSLIAAREATERRAAREARAAEAAAAVEESPEVKDAEESQPAAEEAPAQEPPQSDATAEPQDQSADVATDSPQSDDADAPAGENTEESS